MSDAEIESDIPNCKVVLLGEAGKKNNILISSKKVLVRQV